MSRKLINSIAVLAAAAALSAGTGVASAAVKQPAGGGASKAQGSKARKGSSARRADGRGGRTVRPTRGAVVFVKGTSTGKGPATNADCQKIAADLDTAYVALEDYLIEGDEDSSQGMSDAIGEMEANGIKRGCSFS